MTLQDLIDQARREGKWLWCHYQNLWFSPSQLEAENAKGNFRWGPVNWKLRSPIERLAEAEQKAGEAIEERNRIAREILKR